MGTGMLPLTRRDPRPASAAAVRQHTISILFKVLLPVLGLAIAVGAWWWYTTAFEVRTIILPSPPAVAEALVKQLPRLVEHGRVTLTQSVTGFLIAVVGGVFSGTVIARSRVVSQMTYPWLVAFNAVPKVALAPLLVVWMGFGMQPRIALAVLVCFFPVVLATVAGLRTTPAELVDLARSLDASRLQTFIKVRFPHALPQVFIGIKLALPLSIIGSVIGEFTAGSTGLGFVIKQAATDRAVAFAALVVLAVMSIAMYYVVVGIERLLLPWVRETTG